MKFSIHAFPSSNISRQNYLLIFNLFHKLSHKGYTPLKWRWKLGWQNIYNFLLLHRPKYMTHSSKKRMRRWGWEWVIKEKQTRMMVKMLLPQNARAYDTQSSWMTWKVFVVPEISPRPRHPSMLCTMPDE